MSTNFQFTTSYLQGWWGDKGVSLGEQNIIQKSNTKKGNEDEIIITTY